MTKKTIFNFCIFVFIFTGLNANEDRMKREFTVTTIALDAQNERLQNDYNDEDSNTTIQEDETEKN